MENLPRTWAATGRRGAREWFWTGLPGQTRVCSETRLRS